MRGGGLGSRMTGSQSPSHPPAGVPHGDRTTGAPSGPVERARRFTEEVLAPARRSIDREDRIPEHVLEGLRRGGFLGLSLPREYGGSGLSTLEVARAVEEIGAGSAAVGTLVAVHVSVASYPILRWGTSAQKEAYLPRMARGEWIGAFALTEPSAGSDAQSLATSYRRQGAAFRLRGSKTFISNARLAQVFVTFARSPEAPPPGISAFLVRPGTPGITISPPFPKLGIHGSDTCELSFDDVPVPPDGLLGSEGQGFRIAMETLGAGRIAIAALSLGIARAGFEALRVEVSRRSEPWQRALLARAYVDVEAARVLVERAAMLRDGGLPFAQAASTAKLYASQAAFRIASNGLDVAGREALDRENPSPLEQLFRDSRVLSIVEGTTEIQEMILGRSLVPTPPGSPPPAPS